MAATRTKKTVRLNPLALDAAPKGTRLSLLSGAAGSSGNSAQRGAKSNSREMDAKSVESSKKQSLKTLTKKTAAKKAANHKPAAKELALKESTQPKARRIAASPRKAKSPQTEKLQTDALSDGKTAVKAVKNRTAAKQSPTQVSTQERAERIDTGAAQTALRNRPVAQVRYGDVLSVREIVLGPKSEELGFYETNGEFVSLMHLEGPIDQSRSGFFPLAVAGLVMGGGLGFVTASVLNIRKHTIFLARQSTGQHKYVALDWHGLSHLKRMAFKLGR